MQKKQNAFTLIELLVTLTVIGVLITVGLPNFKEQIFNNKALALGEDFSTRLNQARYEAVKRSSRVTICASSNSTTSTPTCTGSWEEGYIIFVDGATSDTSSTTSIASIIGAYPKSGGNAVIEVKNNSAAISFVRFTSNGTLARISNSTNPVIINAHLTGCKGENKNTITVGLSGLIFSKRVACPT